jgi:hypothetical protein
MNPLCPTDIYHSQTTLGYTSPKYDDKAVGFGGESDDWTSEVSARL